MSVTMVDENFVLPIVNGNGEILERLEPHISYNITFREGYYVALKDGEYENVMPIFIKSKTLQRRIKNGK